MSGLRVRSPGLVAAAVLLAAACGEPDEGAVVVPGTASCTGIQKVTSGGVTTTAKSCADWMEVGPEDLDRLRQTCPPGISGVGTSTTQEQVFAQAPCAREGALGGCRFPSMDPPGTIVTSWRYDDDSDVTLEMVQAMCADAGGTFVTP